MEDELRNLDPNDTFYEEKQERIRDRYKREIEFYESQMQIALGNNKTLYEKDWTAYS
jgi:hypothetical protein